MRPFIRRGAAVGGPRVRPLRVIVALILVATVVVVAIGVARSGPDPFRPRFDADGLVTNELTQRGVDEPGVRSSRDWVATSGSLFGVSGMGWSGKPDDIRPDAASLNGTDSAVFRIVSRRTDFGNVRVTFALKVQHQTSTARTPEQGYDGVHLMVRYKSPQELYTISLQRRDGILTVKRKDAGGPSNGGSYTELATAPYPLVNGWVTVDVTVRDTDDGATQLELRIDRKLILLAADRSAQRIVGPGAIGIRGDNTEFFFRDLVAEHIE